MINYSTWEPRDALLELVATGKIRELGEYAATLHAADSARALALMSEKERSSVFAALGPENAAVLVEALPEAQAAEILEELSPENAAAIVDELEADERADLLGELHHQDAEAILQELGEREAGETRKLLSYPADSAGGLMRLDFVKIPENITVREALEDLQTNRDVYSHFRVQYVFAVDSSGRLTGVIPLRDLIFADGSRGLAEIMRKDPAHVEAEVELEELIDYFDRNPFLGLPVVDDRRRLVGVVERDAVEEEAGNRSEDTLLKVSGIVGGEELRSMPVRVRSVRRLSWLSLNIVLNIIAASVIAIFEGTLQRVIALAVFLPIISDMSGCSGNQAVTVSIRELTLGIVKPQDVWRVMKKEAIVGFINGLALGAIVGLVAYLWRGNAWLGLVVGGALAINTMISVVLGGAVPIVLKRLRRDPALASAPILTTVTDLCGFLLTLGFATLLLSRLAP